MTTASHEAARRDGFVFIATCDLSGVVRGRSVPRSREQEVLASGVGWVPADLALTCFGALAEDTPFDSSDDLRLRVDAASRADLGSDGLSPSPTLYFADQTSLSGSPWECCPRSFLRNAVADLRRDLGLEALVSFEHEFTLRGIPGSHAFSLQRLLSVEPFGSRLLERLEQAGLEPETWLAEYGEGQFEVTLKPAGPLEAADRAILLRLITQELARSMGMHATFAPIPVHGGVGNGVHVHVSLHSADQGPAFFDQAEPAGLSRLGRQFAAGIVNHASALSAITAPTVVSNFRLRPGHWGVAGAVLADRDREALLRLCSGTTRATSSAGSDLNLEYRGADAAANPWLVAGAMLRAGMAGVAGSYPPADLVEVGRLSEVLPSVPPLPQSQAAALTALEGDAVAAGWFAPDLLKTLVAVRRAEAAALDELTDIEICERYADVY